MGSPYTQTLNSRDNVQRQDVNITKQATRDSSESSQTVQTSQQYLALDPSLAAAAVSRVAVQPAVAAALLAREADGPELSFLSRIYARDARGTQEGPAAFGGQRLKEEAVVHLHPVHIQVLVGHVIQGQQVRLGALDRAVPRQLWTTESGEWREEKAG